MRATWCNVCRAVLLLGLVCGIAAAAEGDNTPAKESECIISRKDQPGIDIDKDARGYTIQKYIQDTEKGLINILDVELIAPNAVAIEKTVVLPNSQNGDYVEAVLNKDKSLELKLTSHFNRWYEINETATKLEIQVQIKCTKPTVYTFYANINDTNNHDPEFLEKEPYTFTLPMPLPKDVDLSAFGKKIIAKDVDLTNSAITYTLSSNGSYADLFSVGTVITGVKKEYEAIFKNKNDLDLKEDFELILQATDNGVPQRNTTTTIKIKINRALSIPQFSSHLYNANCTKCKLSNETIKFDKPIELSLGYDSDVNFTLTHPNKDIEKSFSLNVTQNKVEVKLAKIPENYKLEYINLDLTAINLKRGYNRSAVLLISLPERSAVEASSSSGLLAATIILSLLLVGLLIGLAYFYNKHRKNTELRQALFTY